MTRLIIPYSNMIGSNDRFDLTCYDIMGINDILIVRSNDMMGTYELLAFNDTCGFPLHWYDGEL